MPLTDLKVTEYELMFDETEPVSIKIRLRLRKNDEGEIVDLWTIQNGETVLSHYEEYRWKSAEEAYQFWLDNRPMIIATHAEARKVYKE